MDLQFYIIKIQIIKEEKIISKYSERRKLIKKN